MIIFINSNLKISTKVILLREEGELIKLAVIYLKNQYAKNAAEKLENVKEEREVENPSKNQSSTSHCQLLCMQKYDNVYKLTEQNYECH